MRLPGMKYVENRSKKTIVQFLGVNYGEDGTDGQFAETRNLSSRMFPCLSQRVGREVQLGEYTAPSAVWYLDGLIVVDGAELKHNGVKVGNISPGKKHFANVNTKVVIFPDKVMYDTANKEFRSLEAEYTSGENALEFTDEKNLKVHLGSYRAEITGAGKTSEISVKTSDSEADYVKNVTVYDYKITGVLVNAESGRLTYTNAGKVLAANVQVGDLFVATSLGLDGVNSYGRIAKINPREVTSGHSAGPNSPVFYYTEYFRSFEYDRYEVKGTNYEGFDGFEAMNFRVGDTVEVSGCVTYPQNNKTLTIRGITKTESDAGTLYGLTFDQQSFTKGTEAGAVTIKRSVPNLTVICEQDNRLYGAAEDTIYVSALGDPTNFNTYDGVDTDSYAVAVATEGDFTGCIGYGSGVLFFKEDCLHKLMGSYPSEFAVYDYTIPGVAEGSEGSLLNINEAVYYHGREGVYRYTGGAPEKISDNFGLRQFDTAAAGAQGETYYISMRDKRKDAYGLWVYDIRRGIWLQEDGTEAVAFARDGGKLYYIDGGESKLVLVNPESSEEEIEWSATMCRMDEVYLNRKCHSRIMMRLEMEEGAELKIEVSCDGGEFKEHKIFHKGPHKTVMVPIVPNRCDSFQIRLSGAGRTVIRTMMREFELGSEW